MALDEQIAELTRMGSGKIMHLARPGVLVLTAGLVLAGAITCNPVFYGIALASALIAFAIWQITPHISNAARGLKEGLKQDGAVEISIHQWTDAESNRHDSYWGLISMDNQPLWQMEFVTPQNWQLGEGKHSAQLAFIRGVAWPVVVLTSEGLLYPRLKPRRASGAQR
ncbi:MAG: hypothetical protein Q8O28_02370 [Smithellaceae bacterium]|nr:hypothetical protein [Smithellaceae bacterium]